MNVGRSEVGEAVAGQGTHAEFPSTHWSKILSAGAAPGDSPQLEELCRAYWPPLYAFLRRQGHSPHDAEDLVQGFLGRLLAREDLAGVGPEKGRFRTFLLASLRNFVVKQALRDKAQIVITHYQRLLNYIIPDFVHVLVDGHIVKSGGKDLALELEAKGYDWILKHGAVAA